MYEVDMAESDLIRGNVDTVILKVLFEGDRYGYDLIKQINARSGGKWEIKQATLYASLKRLEKQGFVSSYWDSSEAESGGGRRKYFTLTDRGREVFVTYKTEWERSRDLFGELIAGSTPILNVHDFSDIEEETYDIPKRPKARKPRPPKKAEISREEPAAAPAAEPEPARETEPEPAIQSTFFDYSPESFGFNNYSVTADAQTEPPAREAEPEPTAEPEPQPTEPEVPARRIIEAADPHEIMTRMFEQHSEGESYSEARGKFYSEQAAVETFRSKEPDRAPAPAPAPAPVIEKKPVVRSDYASDEAIAFPSPAPAPQKAVTPVPAALPETESEARIAYKDVLADMIARTESFEPETTEQAAVLPPPCEEENDAELVDDVRITRFAHIERATAELGSAVDFREHNDSAKQYVSQYYYYSNKLMMTQYIIMCTAMFVIGMTLFFSFYSGLNIHMKYDFALYIAAGLFPIIMFIVAVLVFIADPDKRKRTNTNFRQSVLVRIVIMLQAAVVIYCLNLLWGMPVAFSAAYIPSLIIPLAYALFIPINKLIFIALYRTGRYTADR